MIGARAPRWEFDIRAQRDDSREDHHSHRINYFLLVFVQRGGFVSVGVFITQLCD